MASVHVLIPAQRHVFSLQGEELVIEPIASSAEGFRRYKELQRDGTPVGMIACPNTVLIRGSEDYLVDPGLIMQGAPVISAMQALGVQPHEVKNVILTHLHFDHAEGMAAWPMRKTYVHKIETEAPYAQVVSGVLEAAELETLDGEEGEIEPGLRWILTPGHCDGLITLLVDTDDGLVAIPSDCVGPLPEYFEKMELPEDFGPERDELLVQWKRIRELEPATVIPGHYPPFSLSR
jgi:N-acyl homoserine lactone hydrolase